MIWLVLYFCLFDFFKSILGENLSWNIFEGIFIGYQILTLISVFYGAVYIAKSEISAKDAAKMNLIRCQKDCVHQNEGYCGLDRAAAVTCAELNQCSFYRVKMPAVERDLPYHVPPFGDPVHTDEPHRPADTRFIQTEEKA